VFLIIRDTFKDLQYILVLLKFKKVKKIMFSELNLCSEIVKAINEIGYKTPTPIQKEVIPKIIEGFDLRASAPTGTGKTAAFILPAINRLMTPSTIKGNGPRVLILVPTRELALQIMTQAKKYSKNISFIKTICIYGGVPYFEQNKDLRSRHDILVATPGRLIDHMERGKIDFSRIEQFILDEADRMLDMGFIEPVKHIAEAIGKDHQTLMFSATLQGEVLRLSESLLKNPLEIKVISNIEENKNIEQKLLYVSNIHHKYELLFDLLHEPEFQQVLIFTSTKRLADELAIKLKENDFQAAALHGDMNQRKRTNTIMQMRKGKIKVLVATDVAARGIDVRSITHVINFDLPQIAEDYVHRIGRTGRAGAKGIALSFVSPRDSRMVREIEKFIGQRIDKKGESNDQNKKSFFSESKTKKRDFRNPDQNFRRERKNFTEKKYDDQQGMIEDKKKPFFSKSMHKGKDFRNPDQNFRREKKNFTEKKYDDQQGMIEDKKKPFFSNSTHKEKDFRNSDGNFREDKNKNKKFSKFRDFNQNECNQQKKFFSNSDRNHQRKRSKNNQQNRKNDLENFVE
jgi:superfamily II DNA/RNA helicase